ncbi:MAG: PEGA domain-containing protein [Planctomycetota bacterium]
MSINQRLWLMSTLMLMGLPMLCGCVERTIKIQTDPPGALVVVNDEEVGISPVRFSFLWYGDYEIILRKAGYHTLKTHCRIDAPWYQWPPIDLISETLVLGTIQDEHVLPTFMLEAAPQATVADVVQRAEELRTRALADSP